MFSPANITTLTPNFSDATVLFKVFQSLNTSYTPDARPKTVTTTNTQSKACDWNYTLSIRKKMTVFICTSFFRWQSIYWPRKQVCMLELLEYSYAHGNQHISNIIWYTCYLFSCLHCIFNNSENYFTHIYYKLSQTSFQCLVTQKCFWFDFFWNYYYSHYTVICQLSYLDF